MNLLHERVWDWLYTAAREGRIHALLFGAPCESWSSARHEPIMDEHGQAVRAPRPLRSAGAPWGLSGLLCKELRQVHIGAILLMKGLRIALGVGFRKGIIFGEHPAAPLQPERASIWRTPVLERFLQLNHIFNKTTICQHEFGSSAVKPTTLLYAGRDMDFLLQRLARKDQVKPVGQMIGMDASGQFRTFQAKEYPCALNRALAFCVVSTAPANVKTCKEIDIEFEAASKFTSESSILPDFQGTG